MDHLRSGKRENVPSHVCFIDLDISSTQIEDVFAREKPDAVIHLAAQADVAYSIQNPVEDANQNTLGTTRTM